MEKIIENVPVIKSDIRYDATGNVYSSESIATCFEKQKDQLIPGCFSFKDLEYVRDVTLEFKLDYDLQTTPFFIKLEKIEGNQLLGSVLVPNTAIGGEFKQTIERFGKGNAVFKPAMLAQFYSGHASLQILAFRLDLD